MTAAIGAWNDVADRRFELRVRRRLQRRLEAPFLTSDPLLRHNTSRGLRLFMLAAFSGLDPARAPSDAGAQLVCALYGMGAIESAARLARLSRFERYRAEVGFLRRVYGVGCLRVHRLRSDLEQRGTTPRGRVVQRAGQVALIEWLHGVDPAPRLQELILRLPAERLLRPGQGSRAPARARTRAALHARIEH